MREEIEKLYNSRKIENDTSSYQKEDNYVDEHNADYYENIEEVKAKEEEQYKLEKEKEEQEKLKQEWQEKVSDFTAQDLLTIKLKRYSTFVYQLLFRNLTKMCRKFIHYLESHFFE